jgi:subtilisin family serine protease
MFFKLCTILLLSTIPLFGEYYLSGGKQIELHLLKKSRETDKNTIAYYQDNQGKQYGVTTELILCAKNDKIRQKVAKNYHLKFLKKLSDTLFLYQSTTIHETLTLCHLISEEEGIKFAHPNFLIKKQKRSEPYYRHQWYLKNRDYRHADINVKEAWQYTKGEGVTTAILDEGIDIDHEDLKKNIIDFANYNDPDTNYPLSKNGRWHGTACAGLMVATENGKGIIGVAPKAKLIAVRYSDDDVAKDIQAFNDLMHKDVAIISNSWGSYTNLDAYNEIFKTLATEGRDGKGILIFFASGNDHQDLDEPNIEDESESPYVISIGASTEKDEIASYSNFGSSIDFLAPGGSLSGELVTTDAMGNKGYTDTNYNFNFIGTSAAAPIAAGVAALILSVNPDLSREEVIDILKQTSKKIGNYRYKDGRNNYAGYGRIDAGKAVQLAQTYNIKTNALSQNSKIDNFAYIMYHSVLKFSK